jgi:tetratricopeptide (TPR) repeat protein
MDEAVRRDAFYRLLKDLVGKQIPSIQATLQKGYSTLKDYERWNAAAMLWVKGSIFLVRREDDAALTLFDQALEIWPEFPELQLDRAFALARIGRRPEARNALKVAEDTMRGGHDLNFAVRGHHLDSGKLAAAYGMLGDRDQMLANLAKAIEEDPIITLCCDIEDGLRDYREDPDFKRLVQDGYTKWKASRDKLRKPEATVDSASLQAAQKDKAVAPQS